MKSSISSAVSAQSQIAVPKLKDAETYKVWKCLTDFSLKSAGVYDLVDDTNKDKPAAQAALNQAEFSKKDAKILKIITETVEENVLSQIAPCTSGKEMYQRIKEMFEYDAEQQKAALMTQFFNFAYKPQRSVAENVKELQKLAERLSARQTPISDPMVIEKLISSLPEKFGNFAASWQSLPFTERNMQNLIARLAALENEINAAAKNCEFCKLKGHTTEECQFLKFATMAVQAPPAANYCTNCQKIGHTLSNCMFLNNLKKESNAAADTNLFCHYCKKPGHTISNCFHLVRKNIVCGYCKKAGHVTQNCRHLPKKCPNVEPGANSMQDPGKEKYSQQNKKLFCSHCKKTNHSYEKCRIRPRDGDQKMSTPDSLENDDNANLCDAMEGLVKDINILILGETGVGKSTWINGFMNFLKYDSLQDAESGDLITTIPSKFTIVNDNFDQVTVSTGNDKNEDLKTGRSATQEAKIYTYEAAPNVNVRLIDTPGIGDTRGMEQDKVNFQNILATLSKLDEIHGICILLKPNNARLTVMFQFCIKELLTHLHRDASKNIVFCFTNTRGTFYRPGDTMPALQELLKEMRDTADIPVNKDTVYCYDSEAYRFLAAIKNDPPIHFVNTERENFARSWVRSFEETTRMLFHIAGLKPHPVKSTINLNYVREMILKMTRPLAEITRNIQTQKAIVTDEKGKIEAMNEDLKQLRTMTMTTRTEIENTPLSHPRTVCSNSKCVKIWSHGNERVNSVEYVKVCHDPCSLNNIPADTVGDPGLIRCWAMQGTNNCTQCSHRYTEHLHIYYQSKQVERQVEDRAVAESIRKNLNAADTKKGMINEKNRLLKELKCEAEFIKQASANFAIFLKNNAITPYNDSMTSYLNHLIREEKDKVERGGDSKVLDGLILDRDSYLEEVKILEAAMKNEVAGARTDFDVTETIKNLEGLKYNGKALGDALRCINQTAQREVNESVVHLPTMTFRKKGRNQKSLVNNFCAAVAKAWR